MTARKSIMIAVVAIAFGLATMIFATWVFLDRLSDPHATDAGVLVRHGVGVWNYSGADAVGIRWRNAQRSTSLQVSTENLGGFAGEWDDGASTGWCLLAEAPLRTGALAVGWPSPWVVWRFWAKESIESFPPTAETADPVFSMTRAVTLVLDGDGQLAVTRSTTMSAILTLVATTGLWTVAIIMLLRSRQKARLIKRAAGE